MSRTEPQAVRTAGRVLSVHVVLFDENGDLVSPENIARHLTDAATTSELDRVGMARAAVRTQVARQWDQVRILAQRSDINVVDPRTVTHERIPSIVEARDIVATKPKDTRADATATPPTHSTAASVSPDRSDSRMSLDTLRTRLIETTGRSMIRFRAVRVPTSHASDIASVSGM